MPFSYIACSKLQQSSNKGAAAENENILDDFSMHELKGKDNYETLAAVNVSDWTTEWDF